MESEIEYLATVVHGAGAALSALGILYNWRRGQRFDTAANTLSMVVCLYHVVAAYKHAKHYKEEKDNE